MRIELHPAFVLHHRPFRETSLLLDLFTRDHGRLPVVARGVRTPRSRWRALLQPFSPLLVSCHGRGELLTLTLADSPQPRFLEGDALTGGFYFNELLVRFLQREDPHPALFDAYAAALEGLSQHGLQERILRLFEKSLLIELGYGLALSGKGVEPDAWYRFYPDQGLVRCEGPDTGGNVFPGHCLLSLASDQLDEAESLQNAKKLMRLALSALPGAKPLQSRRLLQERKNT